MLQAISMVQSSGLTRLLQGVWGFKGTMRNLGHQGFRVEGFQVFGSLQEFGDTGSQGFIGFRA